MTTRRATTEGPRDADGLTAAQRAALDARDERLKELGADGWVRIYRTHDELRSRYAYLEGDDAVVDLQDPTRVIPWRAFKNATAGSFRTVIGPRGGERRVLIAQDWLEDSERITVYGRTFVPRAPRITPDLTGRPAVNLWREPAIAGVALPADWEARARAFDRHIAYLVPDPTEAALVARWLAHIVQRPDVLPGWHVLLIAEGVFGTGRNWLARAMKRMLPDTTREDLPLKRLLEGKFNGEIDGITLGVVDEIREGSKDQWDRENELRSFLTAKTRVINEKFRQPYEVRNFLRVLMFSNHLDALPTPEGDRRLFVAQCTTTPREQPYYDALYAALDDPGTLRALYERLVRMDLSGFPAEGRAPPSEMKRTMATAVRSDEENELRRLIAEWPSEVMLGAHLRAALQALRDDDLAFGEDRHRSDQLSTGQLRRLYRVCGLRRTRQVRAHPWEVGLAPEPQTVDPNQQKFKYRLVAIRNVERWTRPDVSETDLREEVRRGMIAAEKDEPVARSRAADLH